MNHDLTPSKRAEILEDIRLQLVKEEASEAEIIVFMDIITRQDDEELYCTNGIFWNARV